MSGEEGGIKPLGGQHGAQNSHKPRTHNLVHRFGTKLKNGVFKLGRVGGAAIGIVAVVNIGSYYYQSKQVEEFFGVPSDEDDEKNNSSSKQQQQHKKRVLVLPFDNLKVIERRKSGDFDTQRFLDRLNNNKQPTIEIEAKEIVNIIHNAASDPNITSLYADFGEGLRYPIGYAHIEEIRNAIRIFNESHRVHRDPNVHHNPIFAIMRNGNPKVSYAFGHTFQWNEYFLASAFTYVNLQARGNLHLFGVAMTNTFLGGMLDKYGIKAHVFRHGQYKNAPSIFSDRKYSKSHLENVQSMCHSMNNTIRTCIGNSRALNFDKVMWQSIFDYGSLTSSNAAEIGLVDALPAVDPLFSLLDVNKAEAEEKQKKIKAEKKAEDDDTQKDNNKTKFEDKFGINECYTKFTATEPVSLVKYKQMLDKKEKIERTHRKINNILQELSEKSTATSMILSGLDIHPDKMSSSRRDKVAVLTVDGSIDSSLSYEVVRSLRQIKNDKHVKSVVLRVNSPGGSVISSEAILEEMKLLDKPVICSMSNAAASGGYYIAMNSEKIFAHPTTITGSIGVFGVKFDASKWANSYGISGDSYPRGSHATAQHPLTPLTPGTKGNISRQVLDYYDYFKRIVATGRPLSLDQVEKVAQGRVWTGEQAKEVGLVDELGGLERAISYAKTTHTNTEEVDVDHWPKKKGLLASILQPTAMVLGRSNDNTLSIEQLLSEMSRLTFADKTHFLMTMDENTALDIILRGE